MKELQTLNQILNIVEKASRMKARNADQRRKDRHLEIAEARLDLTRQRQQTTN